MSYGKNSNDDDLQQSIELPLIDFLVAEWGEYNITFVPSDDASDQQKESIVFVNGPLCSLIEEMLRDVEQHLDRKRILKISHGGGTKYSFHVVDLAGIGDFKEFDNPTFLPLLTKIARLAQDQWKESTKRQSNVTA